MVAQQRLRRLGAQLALLLGVAEAAAAPAGLEQPEQLGQRAGRRAAGVEALEHLVDEDPEALVERRLGRDPEDARELVLQRARPVGLDVGRAQHQPVAAAREERLERRLGALRDRPRAQLLVALGVEQVLVERRRLEDLALLRGRRLQQPRVDLRQRVGDRLPAVAGALHQRRQLEHLEVAHDRVRDVEVGVEAQLAEPPADLRDRRQQLVAQQPERRLQRLGGAEQLLLARLPLAADGAPRLLGERRRRLRRAALGHGRVGEHEPPPRARHRDVQQPPHRGDVRRLGVRRQRLLDQRVGDRLERAPARARACAPRSGRARRRGRTRAPWPRASPSPARRAGARRRPPPPRAARRRRRRRSSGRTRARSPAASGARSRRRARRTWPG